MMWAPIVVRLEAYMTSSDDLKIDEFFSIFGIFTYDVARERHEFRKRL